ncbi:hypothetical protein LPY66_15105 [Dehalobacter sp. DCM]|uniref:hypothetical protein n=1 Tax=Dehalobacter sp. DCM TaxID=2907827 RepID=UPI003081734D|nr:hypothetical protein LPY66_15105 [Dehalobacter sp. DCM]
MIQYAFILLILASSYYTFTFGQSLWRDDHNKLGGFGAMLIAFISASLPVFFMFIGR